MYISKAAYQFEFHPNNFFPKNVTLIDFVFRFENVVDSTGDNLNRCVYF